MVNLIEFFSKEEQTKARIGVTTPATAYSRDYETSPIFSFSNSSTITAGNQDVIDFATVKPATAKYLPFNTLQILNNSSVVISVYINQKRDRPIKIPAGVIQPIDSTIAPAINSLLIENNDGSTSISANELQFLVSKDNVTTDLLAKRVHNLLFKGRN